MFLEIAELMFFMYLVFSSDSPEMGMGVIRKYFTTTLLNFRYVRTLEKCHLKPTAQGNVILNLWSKSIRC